MSISVFRFLRGDATILIADALEALRRMPAESLQMCVTSPPYWGLRDYGIPGRAWGGDPNHSHEWGAAVATRATKHLDKRRWNHARNGRGEAQPVAKLPASKGQIVPQGNFCECGAWYGALGLEPTIDLYVKHIVEVFREVRRVLKNDGTLWLNLGDSYAASRSYQVADNKNPRVGPTRHMGRATPPKGLKPKDLCMIPARVALAMQADGWYLRSDIVWHKTNPMPESVTDRPTRSHEYIFLLSKSQRYFYHAEAIKEPTTGSAHDRARKDRAYPGQKTLPSIDRNGIRPAGVNPKAQKFPSGWSAEPVDRRNKRTVWTLPTKPFSGAHFATFPPKLIEPCILAGSRPGDVVLDPFNGAGTSGVVAIAHGRRYLGIELNREYAEMARERIVESVPAAHTQKRLASAA